MNKLRVFQLAALFLFIMMMVFRVSPSNAAPVTKAWQPKWDKLVSEAKKEGVVVICSSVGPQLRERFSKAFTGKYGVTLEFVPGKPAELIPKIQMQRRAGIYADDVFLAGIGTVALSLGPEGALEPLDPILLLPEVTDGKNWWGGALLWPDRAHYQLAFLAFPGIPIIANTNQVKSEELKSYRDLLDPKWKGKIACLDPTMAGFSNSLFTFIAESPLGLDYLRELGKQEPAVTRDNRILMEWVARGKYPIAVGIKPDAITEFRKAGAPIVIKEMAEGSFLGAGGGCVLLMNKAPHPNAAALFINWLLSREGQIIASQEYGAQSARVDIPTDFLDPATVRQPGMKYYSEMGEGVEKKKREYMKIVGEMWGHLLK